MASLQAACNVGTEIIDLKHNNFKGQLYKL